MDTLKVFGGQGRSRTADAGLFRAALYQLSYLASGVQKRRSIGTRSNGCQLQAGLLCKLGVLSVSVVQPQTLSAPSLLLFGEFVGFVTKNR
jgi:hypothetical protein